ncbi:hypothetical protein TNCT_431301 [Trichonephila clavata]|uniref:Uncharacterized protein n=1 Tax=Trichonephila clavata TaxID=2740835 RepID=A0A8X6HPA9_TRICU|nr:hypothetical protein TNCT_431301 [Trichonephila clavata]
MLSSALSASPICRCGPRRSVFSPRWEVTPGYSYWVRFRLRTSEVQKCEESPCRICGSSRNNQDCHHSDLPFVSETLNINKDAQQIVSTVFQKLYCTEVQKCELRNKKKTKTKILPAKQGEKNKTAKKKYTIIQFYNKNILFNNPSKKVFLRF